MLNSVQIKISTNHKKSFKCGMYENDIELSKYVYSLKCKKIDFEITWELIKIAQNICDGNNPSKYISNCA